MEEDENNKKKKKEGELCIISLLVVCGEIPFAYLSTVELLLLNV